MGVHIHIWTPHLKKWGSTDPWTPWLRGPCSRAALILQAAADITAMIQSVTQKWMLTDRVHVVLRDYANNVSKGLLRTLGYRQPDCTRCSCA